MLHGDILEIQVVAPYTVLVVLSSAKRAWMNKKQTTTKNLLVEYVVLLSIYPAHVLLSNVVLVVHAALSLTSWSSYSYPCLGLCMSSPSCMLTPTTNGIEALQRPRKEVGLSIMKIGKCDWQRDLLTRCKSLLQSEDFHLVLKLRGIELVREPSILDDLARQLQFWHWSEKSTKILKQWNCYIILKLAFG